MAFSFDNPGEYCAFVPTEPGFGECMNLSFNVVRLIYGKHAGKVFILPSKTRSHKSSPGLPIRAEVLVCNVSYREAFYYASGFLLGTTKQTMSPYVKPGDSLVWHSISE